MEMFCVLKEKEITSTKRQITCFLYRKNHFLLTSVGYTNKRTVFKKTHCVHGSKLHFLGLFAFYSSQVLESGFVFLQKEMGLCMRKDGDLQDVVSKIAIGDPSVKNKKEDLVEEKAKGAMKTQSKSAETLSIRVFGDSCANVSFPSHSSGEAQTSSSVPMEQAGIRASSNMIPTSIPQTQARAQVRQQVNPPLTPNPSAAIESIGNSKTLTPIISNTLSLMQHIIEEVEKEEKKTKGNVNRTNWHKCHQTTIFGRRKCKHSRIDYCGSNIKRYFGHVFEVVGKNANVKYALKVSKIDPEKKDRIISILHNELNILQILSGLNGVINRSNRKLEVKLIIRQLLTTLEQMHRFNIVHRFFFKKNSFNQKSSTQ
ncbi:hypothetical protein RFI_25718 [Reticulomyxa filosa]|uniref:Protein kinase domain-containing protein n=1 Tax=Reticulomyxa filosa TaxID=46433 RepID=X6MCP9_RETFI|nr:hypothetical protein RFI_25718 [Reticulomyxa filosa]|eukprot:ETO11659.1 hypothetical protein RFI_25718 [Reticulomyxa filosa]